MDLGFGAYVFEAGCRARLTCFRISAGFHFRVWNLFSPVLSGLGFRVWEP